MNNFWNTQSNFTLISLITFEVFSQTLPNVQGSRRNTIQWCLQNYIVNGWELTFELTSKCIYILKYSSKFTTNLTNNFKSTRSNFTEFTHLAVSGLTVRLPVWPWQQVCVKRVRKWGVASNMNIHYDVTGLLTAAWRSHSGQIVWAAWINCQLAREEEGGGGFWTHSTYTGYPGSAGGRQLDRWRWIYRAVAEIPSDGACKNYMVNGWELTSELTSKWINFEILKQIYH